MKNVGGTWIYWQWRLKGRIYLLLQRQNSHKIEAIIQKEYLPYWCHLFWPFGSIFLSENYLKEEWYFEPIYWSIIAVSINKFNELLDNPLPRHSNVYSSWLYNIFALKWSMHDTSKVILIKVLRYEISGKWTKILVTIQRFAEYFMYYQLFIFLLLTHFLIST